MDIEVARYALRTFRLFYGDEYERLEACTTSVSNGGPGGMVSVSFTYDWAKADTPLGWTSVSMAGGHWSGGVCEAKCVTMAPLLPPGYLWMGGHRETAHSSPDEGCHCGIYGTLNLPHLHAQYRQYCENIVAVIAAEGNTIIGDRGLRTECARVVAYWCAEEFREMSLAQFPGAEVFLDVEQLCRHYGLPAETASAENPGF